MIVSRMVLTVLLQPAEFMTKTGQFFSEFIASTILMFVIYALKDVGVAIVGDGGGG